MTILRALLLLVLALLAPALPAHATLVLADRTAETSTTTGTGALTLLGATSNHISFSSGVGVGNTTYYAIVSRSPVTEWEVGLGTLSGASTLTRTTPFYTWDGATYCTSSCSALTLSAGTKDVFVTIPSGVVTGSNITQSIAVTSTPTLGGLTLNGDLAFGTDAAQITKTGSTTTSVLKLFKLIPHASSVNSAPFEASYSMVNVFDGEPDPTMYWGYNATRDVATEPTMRWVIEGNYLHASGTQRDVETYWEFIDATGVTQRPIFFYRGKTSGTHGLLLTSDSLTLAPASTNGDLVVHLSATGGSEGTWFQGDTDRAVGMWAGAPFGTGAGFKLFSAGHPSTPGQIQMRATADSVDSVRIYNSVANTGTSSATRVFLATDATYGPTSTSSMVGVGLDLKTTINYSAGTPGSGHVEAVKIRVVETALPTGTSYLIRASAGAAGTTDRWTLTTSGIVSMSPRSISGTPATTGSYFNIATATFTDSNTAGSGTAASFAAYAFQAPTLAASNSSVTTTNASTVYISGAPIQGANETLANPWALYVASGNIKAASGSITASGGYIAGSSAGLASQTLTVCKGVTCAGGDQCTVTIVGGLVTASTC